MKKKILLIAFFCSSLSMFAQDFALKYNTDLASETIIIRDVYKTTSEDLLVGYDFKESGAAFSAGVMKTDSEGTVIWSKVLVIDSSAAGCTFEVIENTAGNFYLWGLSKELETDHMRAILSEITMDGEMLWSKEYDFGFNYSTAYTVNKLAVLPSGDLQMMISVYEKVIVMKTNPSGEIIWGNYSSIGPPDDGGKNPGFEYLTIPDDGGLCASKENNNFSLLRYNNDGEIIWNQSYNIGIYTHGKTIARSPNGNVLIGGFIDYVPHIMEISDEDGSIVWIKFFEGHTMPHEGMAHLSILGESILFDFTNDDDQQYIVELNVAGEVLKTMQTKYTVYDYNKIEIIDETESYFYGGASMVTGWEGIIERTASVLEESCTLMEIDPFYLINYTDYDTVGFDPFSTEFNNEADISIALTDPGMSASEICETEVDDTGIDSDKANVISVYPNPVSNLVTINVANSAINATYSLTNLSGKTVLTDRINATEMQIDLSVLSQGQYIFSIQTENELTTEKITVIK